MYDRRNKIPNIIKKYVKKNNLELDYMGLNFYKEPLYKFRIGDTCHNFLVKDGIIKHSLHQLKPTLQEDGTTKYVTSFPKGELEGKKERRSI